MRGSRNAAGSKSSTVPATLLEKRDGSNFASGLINDWPLSIPSQKAVTPVPAGVTTPNPVITASFGIDIPFSQKAERTIADWKPPKPLAVDTIGLTACSLALFGT